MNKHAETLINKEKNFIIPEVYTEIATIEMKCMHIVQAEWKVHFGFLIFYSFVVIATLFVR